MNIEPFAIRIPKIIAGAFILCMTAQSALADTYLPRPSVSPLRDEAIDRLMPPLSRVAADVQVTGSTNTDLSSPPHVTPEFGQFLREQARFDYARRGPEARVADRNAFAEMQRYLFNRYNGLTVVGTLHEGGHAFDCIPIAQQPGLRDGSAIAAPPALEPSPYSVAHEDIPPPRCGAGTVPLERLSLDTLVAHPSVHAFLGRNRASGSALATSQATRDVHYYASAFMDMDDSPVTGAGVDLNVWSPAFASSLDYMSISQLWLAGRTPGNLTQTLEVGWQKRPAYGWGSNSITFIYSTTDSYRTGCHNLECGYFVQTASGNYLGTAYATSGYGVQGGNQAMLGVEFQRNTDGNWWLRLNGQWIGYYKAALYSGDLASGNSNVEYSTGGETLATDGAPRTPMGSGQFAAAGYRHAAFHANHYYRDSALNTHAVRTLSGLTLTNPRCYTVALAGLDFPYQTPAGVGQASAAPEMKTGGFYFGGPGCP